MSGWIVPPKDTRYPLNSNTLYITTESVTGGSDVVIFSLFFDRGYYFTNIRWRFSDWVYYTAYCTLYYQKFPVTPPTLTTHIMMTGVQVELKER